jgi:hypothetical protein
MPQETERDSAGGPLAGVRVHTREVLAEAGLAEAEIARLEAAGVLSSGPAAEGTPAPPG